MCGMNRVKGSIMRYEYERVKLDKNNYALNADMESHRSIIDRKASEGHATWDGSPLCKGRRARPWSST